MRRRTAAAAALGAAVAIGVGAAAWRALQGEAPPQLAEGSPFEGIPEDHDPDGLTALEARAAFFEAARSDLERPWPLSDPASVRRYVRAASEILPKIERGFDSESPAAMVAYVLIHLEQPEATEALSAWLLRPSTRSEHRRKILDAMRDFPRPAWLAAVRAVLASDALAAEIVNLRTQGGFKRTGRCWARASVKVLALGVAQAIPDGAGRALLREIANDRARSEPDPRTVAAIPPEARQDPDLSGAVASLRLMALAELDDPALIRAAAEDPTEPELIRRWAGLMNRPMPTYQQRIHEAEEPVFITSPVCH